MWVYREQMNWGAGEPEYVVGYIVPSEDGAFMEQVEKYDSPIMARNAVNYLNGGRGL